MSVVDPGGTAPLMPIAEPLNPVEPDETSASCGLCGRPYRWGEIMVGIRVGHVEEPGIDHRLWKQPGEYYEGHYDCVTDALGPARALAAINAGAMAPRNVAMASAGTILGPDGIRVRVAQPGPVVKQ